MAQARSCLIRAQGLTRKTESEISDLVDALNHFHQAALVARLPAKLVELHQRVQLYYWINGHVGNRAANMRDAPAMAFLAENTSGLLHALIWHPGRTRFYSWYRTWRYARLFAADTRLRDEATRDEIQKVSEDYSIFPFGRKEYREIIKASRRLKKDSSIPPPPSEP